MSDDSEEYREAEDDGSHDISPLLDGWDYEPGSINVRKVVGIDGQPKLQMRLELGVLQMEVTGRPDGARPNGFESLLEFHENRLKDHKKLAGTQPAGFALSPDQCQALREEAAMYYQRYLSLFVLGDFRGVVRDTTRNLRVLDLCNRFAQQDHDKIVLEQYRPYIVMMRTRADASILAGENKFHQALDGIRTGLAEIRSFFERYNQADAFENCEEARVLKRLAREIKRKLPVGPVERLQRKLKKAVANEDYELAAKLRDQISQIQGPSNTNQGKLS